MSPTSADLVVLGAGVAGLTTAWRAARRGLQVVLLEQAPHVGGLAAGLEVAGVRVDQGSHRLDPATPPDLLADLHGLLGEDLQTRPRNGRLDVAGSWVGYPLRAGELARTLPTSLLAGVGRDALTGPLRRPRSDTYADVLRASLGPTLYGALYGPYAQKLWGIPGERIGGEQARRRVSADTPWKVAVRVARPQRGGAGGQPTHFHYPRRGFGQLVEALAGAANGGGARIRVEAEVDQLRVRGDGVSARLTNGDVVTARRAFSTIPMPRLARITSPGAPLAAIEAAGRLRFRAKVLVYVEHEGGRWTPYDTHYLPGPQTPITRLSEPANYRLSSDDPVDRSVLCAEIPCAVGDDVWSSSDAELADLVDDGLARTGLPSVHRGAVLVRRIEQAYPVYAYGYEVHLAALDEWARGLPAVTTYGRLGLFAHHSTHHSIAMAYDAVAAFGPDGGWDDAAWAAARKRFAGHVVDD